MKKIFFSIFAIVIVFSFASCNAMYDKNSDALSSVPGGEASYDIVDDSEVSDIDDSEAPDFDMSDFDGDYTDNIAFEAHCIRTDGYIGGEEYPKTFWITSVGELNDYYEANKDEYYLGRRTNPLADQTMGFLDVIEKYDDRFFEEHSLIFVVLEEGSGSIRHEVTDIKLAIVDGTDVRYVILPCVERIVPEIGTDDMAEWHIIIEIDSHYGPENSFLAQASVSSRVKKYGE